MIHKITLFFVALFFTNALTLLAQNTRVHPDDNDGNGTISRTEWRGNRSEFRQLDTNRDGMLSGTEIPGEPPTWLAVCRGPQHV